MSKALRFVQGPVSSRARSMAQEEFGAADNVRFTFGGVVDSSWIAISGRQTGESDVRGASVEKLTA